MKMDSSLAASRQARSGEHWFVRFELREKADKRRKLYKTVDKYGGVLESEAIRSWNIGDWLRDKLLEIGKELDREAYAYFTGAVGMMQQVSLAYLDKEFDKLALYTTERRLTKKDLLQVFSSIPEVSGFAMVDAVSAHDVKRALQLLQRQVLLQKAQRAEGFVLVKMQLFAAGLPAAAGRNGGKVGIGKPCPVLGDDLFRRKAAGALAALQRTGQVGHGGSGLLLPGQLGTADQHPGQRVRRPADRGRTHPSARAEGPVLHRC